MINESHDAIRSLGETILGIHQDIPPAWEFYDQKNDPEELHNRYNDPAFKKIIEILKVELKKKREGLNETDENYREIQILVKNH